MGVSVLKGAFTSLLGGLPLFLSASEGFRIFAAMWVGIIIIAVLHGFLFVPAVMYEVWELYKCCCSKYKDEIPRKSATSTGRTMESAKDVPRPSDMSIHSNGQMQNSIPLETIMSERESNPNTKNDILQTSQSPQMNNIEQKNDILQTSQSPQMNNIDQKNDTASVVVEPTDRDKNSLELNEATLAEMLDI
eukprot:474614_1